MLLKKRRTVAETAVGRTSVRRNNDDSSNEDGLQYKPSILNKLMQRKANLVGHIFSNLLHLCQRQFPVCSIPSRILYYRQKAYRRLHI